MDLNAGAAKVLAEAKSLVASRGWCQGSLYSSDGRLCLVGALHSASEHAGVSRAEAWIAKRAVAEAIGTPNPEEIPRWNDRPHRTVDEVVSALDKAEHLTLEGRVGIATGKPPIPSQIARCTFIS